MKNNLKLNIAKLAFSKETFSERMRYILMGIAYYPFLMLEYNKTADKGRDQDQASSEGDDVYPLF